MKTATGNRTSEAIDRLAAGIAELTSSEAWLSYLGAARRFHTYSFGNTVLIYRQSPEATHVAGFHTWRALGRAVRRGEHAIWIFAPLKRKVTADDGAGQDDSRRVVTGFRAVPVFDISQTEGEPLPDVPCNRLSGDDPAGSYDQLRQIAHDLGYTVEECQLPGEANGVCEFTERRTRIEVRNDTLQQVKSLAHEIAHALLHDGFEGTRELAELEAESVAFIICEGVGLDSAAYSFGYVAHWAGSGDDAIAGIKASGARIQSAARRVLDAMDGGAGAA